MLFRSDRAATTADTTTPPAAAEAPAAKTATPAPVDPDARRFDCQADTAVVVLDGTARVTLPGGELHALQKVAESDPEVYVGDSLYFTLGADAAHLSQQDGMRRSEEHTSELQSLMRISYAVFCLKKKKTTSTDTQQHNKPNLQPQPYN